MARGGTLTKLRSAIKRWPSFTKLTRTASSIAAASDHDHDNDNDNNNSMSFSDRLPVYVGKSRRRYLLSPRVVEHPLFRELVGKSSSSGEDSDDGDIVVACEVVLFEHMLWMLENGGTQTDSMDELAEFYTC